MLTFCTATFFVTGVSVTKPHLSDESVHCSLRTRRISLSVSTVRDPLPTIYTSQFILVIIIVTQSWPRTKQIDVVTKLPIYIQKITVQFSAGLPSVVINFISFYSSSSRGLLYLGQISFLHISYMRTIHCHLRITLNVIS